MPTTYEIGRIGLNARGAYSAATAYAALDTVSYLGSSYVCKTACTGIAPTDTASWQLLAQGESQAPEWTQATLASGVTAASLGNGALRYRAVGNHVYVAGGVTAAWNGSVSTGITTLPAGLRPQYSPIYWLKPCSGKKIARIYVHTNGELCLEWVVSISDGANSTAATWLDCNLDFWADTLPE